MEHGDPNNMADIIGRLGKLGKELGSSEFLKNMEKAKSAFEIVKKETCKGKEVSLNKGGIITISGCNLDDFEKIKATID